MLNVPNKGKMGPYGRGSKMSRGKGPCGDNGIGGGR